VLRAVDFLGPIHSIAVSVLPPSLAPLHTVHTRLESTHCTQMYTLVHRSCSEIWKRAKRFVYQSINTLSVNVNKPSNNLRELSLSLRLSLCVHLSWREVLLTECIVTVSSTMGVHQLIYLLEDVPHDPLDLHNPPGAPGGAPATETLDAPHPGGAATATAAPHWTCSYGRRTRL